MTESLPAPMLLENLSPIELHAIRTFFPLRTFADGTLLFKQGDTADGCYLVESGQVLVFTHMPNVGEVPVGTIGPGDIVGESVLLSPAPYTHSAKAVGLVSAYYVDGRHVAIFQSLINPLHFDALHAFATILAHRTQKWLKFAPVNTDMSNPQDRGPLGSREKPGCSFRYESFMEVLPVFKGFSRADLKYLLEMSTPWEIARGRYLFVAGDSPELCFFTIRGAAEMRYCPQPQGRRLNLFGPGRVLDPIELVLGTARVTECRAREPSVILSFERRRFTALVQEKHPLAAKLLSAALYELLVRLVRANRLFAASHVAISLGIAGG
jgi:CRP/FNR family transcriptional regulator, cyclic AMP receptor protein